MKTTNLFALIAAVPFLLVSCLGSNDDNNNDNKPQNVIETAVTFEDASLKSDGTMQGSTYVSNPATGYVFDSFTDKVNDSTVISYGYTVSRLADIRTEGEISPYSVFSNMTNSQGTKFAAYIPHKEHPCYIHRPDGTTFKPYYMDIAISTKTLQAAMKGYGEEKAFGETDSVFVSIRGINDMGTATVNKLDFNIIYKNGLLQLDSYSGRYGYLKLSYVGSYTNLWVPLYLTDLGSVNKILIEMKSTKENTPLGIAIDNFATYTTPTSNTQTK